MVGVIVAGFALTLHALARSWSLGAVVGVSVVALVVVGLCAVSAAYLGHETPRTTRVLVALWAPGVLLVLGGLTAIVARLSVDAVAGDDASSAEKTTAALVAAALAAVGSQLNGWLPRHLSPWLARTLTWEKYSDTYFPCLPIGMPKGAAAWNALGDARKQFPDAWKGSNYQSLLAVMKDAIDSGQSATSPDWKCPE